MSLLSGSTRGAGGRALSRHLLSPTHNETVVVIEPRGLVAEGLHEQLDELCRGAITTRTSRPVYHVHCDPADWCEAVRDAFWRHFEVEFDLAEARYCGAVHDKNGRRHEHRVYDLTRDDGSVVSLSFDRLRREKVAVLVAYEHGLSAPPVKHVRAVSAALSKEGHCEAAEFLNAGRNRPVRIAAKTPQERAIEGRKSTDKVSVAERVLAAWQSADSGPAFAQALADRGLNLAAGEKVAVVIDETGAVWPVARLVGQATRAEGLRVKSAEVKKRLANIPLASLEEVRQARPNKAVVGDRDADPLVNSAAEAVPVEASRQNEPVKTGDIPRIPQGMYAIAMPELARQLDKNTADGPIEQHLRDIERRERSARERLAGLYQPIHEPLDLKQVRQHFANLASRVRDIEGEESRKAALLAKMKRARPSGVWAWLTGKIRSHDRIAKQIDSERSEIVDRLNGARIALWRAQGAVEISERRWRDLLRGIETDRARIRDEIACELRWVRDARASIKKDPRAAASAAALANAIEKLRVQRQPQRNLSRAHALDIGRGQSYRPRF